MDRELINNVNLIYQSYINNSNNNYVFTYIDDNIVILQKVDITITNENRQNIINSYYAKYYGYNFKVEHIFNLWNPYITFKTKNLDCCNNKNDKITLILTKNKFIRTSNEEEEIDDSDIIMHDLYYLDYYNNINIVIYKILHRYITNLNNYRGELYTWSDNGELLSHQIYY